MRVAPVCAVCLWNAALAHRLCMRRVEDSVFGVILSYFWSVVLSPVWSGHLLVILVSKEVTFLSASLRPPPKLKRHPKDLLLTAARLETFRFMEIEVTPIGRLERRGCWCAHPNQSLEPTGLASTPRACARVAPAKPVAHHITLGGFSSK